MKNLRHTFIALVLLVTSSCLKLTKDEESSPKGSEVVPAAVESIVHNFNPTKSFELSGLLGDYPEATSIYIGVEGVTGVQLSAEEAKLVGSVTLGARGTASHYNVIISTPSGNIRTILK
jgi:hypothetical protein